MLCDKCHKREARIYYTEILNGEKKEQHLCEECASEFTSFHLESAGINKEISLGGLFSSIFGNYHGETQAPEQKKPIIKCDTCGMTYEEFLQEGKFGCADCYKYFSKVLDRSLKQIHGANNHTGKRPIGYTAEPVITEVSPIDKLTIRLQEAIEREEYEEAAKLRDEIRVLKASEVKDIG